jgi:hypothetical protein
MIDLSANRVDHRAAAPDMHRMRTATPRFLDASKRGFVERHSDGPCKFKLHLISDQEIRRPLSWREPRSIRQPAR